MRTRSKLFFVFLAMLLVVASIVEASNRRKKNGNGKKKGNKKPALNTLHDAPGSGREIPVERNIDEAFKTAPSTGTRHSRFYEKTEAIEEASTDTGPLATFPEHVQAEF